MTVGDSLPEDDEEVAAELKKIGAHAVVCRAAAGAARPLLRALPAACSAHLPARRRHAAGLCPAPRAVVEKREAREKKKRARKARRLTKVTNVHLKHLLEGEAPTNIETA